MALGDEILGRAVPKAFGTDAAEITGRNIRANPFGLNYIIHCESGRESAITVIMDLRDASLSQF
jgi:hypothetical protein